MDNFIIFLKKNIVTIGNLSRSDIWVAQISESESGLDTKQQQRHAQ
jgi:hypothetical protein